MPGENEDVLQKLAPSIVEIISDKKEEDSTTLGTGFVVTDDGLIVTCRHVITDSEGNLVQSVQVRFYSDNKTETKDFTASPLKGDKDLREDPFIDIAFLNLDKLPEKGVTPVKLDDKVVSLNHFASIGFKKAEEFTRLSAEGKIRIPTHIRISKDVLSPEVIQLYSPDNEIEPGMSGAPVLDVERDRIVGIVTERYREEYNPAVSNMAFALPVKAMIELFPVLREKNQGLTVLSKFLQAIGEERSSIYKWIDEVYEPPIEYEDIKESLKSKRIVFITGTKEFGKTFTAVRLMYEFFKDEGYQPRWIKERNEQRGFEGSDPQELMKVTRLEDYLKPREIVYFEDPFGKTEYERSDDLERHIGGIIDSIKQVHDSYIIITSREEVFKEFEMEKLSEIDLANFEKKINMKRASYGIEGRKEMLLKWARVNNCRWLLDTALTDHTLETIEYKQLLPTPLNIKDFVIASRDIVDNRQLEELIQQKSDETTRGFADEIIRMDEDEKVLFLAFAYVGYGFLDVDVVKKVYKSIIATRESSQEYYMDFETVKKWFEGDKINISKSIYMPHGAIAFSHPSYHEAFQYAIQSERRYNERINSSRIRAILGEVLLRLQYERGAENYVAMGIARNFNNLPSHIQQLLFKLANNDEAALSLAYAIVSNFYNLPSHIQQLLFKLANKKEAAAGVAMGIVDNFNNLPSHIQQLLFKLANKEETAAGVAMGIARNFNNLPLNVREQLLLKLANKKEAAAGVAYAIAMNFNNLPSHIQQLLFKLANKEETAADVTMGIVDNFNNLPSHIQQLLFKLANNDRALANIADGIVRNFNNLPSHIQQLLFKLADNDMAVSVIASGIVYHFDNLPPNVREQLLLKLANKKEAAAGVAYAIAMNFNNLPSHIQQLLFKLADKDSTTGTVSSVITEHGDNIPEDVKKQILAKLEGKRHHTRKRLPRR